MNKDLYYLIERLKGLSTALLADTIQVKKLCSTDVDMSKLEQSAKSLQEFLIDQGHIILKEDE